MINESQKKEIAGQIKAFQKRTGKSGNEISKSIPGISNATLSNMINGKWQSINEDKWRLIANFIKFEIPAETSVFMKVSGLLNYCQKYKTTKVFLAEAGSGKTYTSRHYTNNNKEVYYVRCGQWSKNLFIERLIGAFGKDVAGIKTTERAEALKIFITEKNNPLLIIDELDKLQTPALLFLIELYNDINDFCGMLFCCTEAFKNRIIKSVRKGKDGFEELLSRFGGSFVEWEADQERKVLDMTAICRVRGINDEDEIFNIIAKSKNIVNKYDMRILDEQIREYKLRDELFTVNN